MSNSNSYSKYNTKKEKEVVPDLKDEHLACLLDDEDEQRVEKIFPAKESELTSDHKNPQDRVSSMNNVE